MAARFDTPLTRLLGLAVPIVQAPIGGLSNPRLAAAVSNAGGLGTLALTWADLAGVRNAIRETRRLTDRPFAANLVLQWPQADRVAICLEEGIPVISFFWGDPAAHIEDIQAAGSLVALTVGSAEEARQAVAAGVDIVVAQGWEAGGHVWGKVSTLPLVPAVVDAVPEDVPVIAAGGIADGRGLAAALALGAAGAWMGTRFVMAEESLAHPRYRELVAAARESDTFYSELFDVGWPNAPHRTLHNSTIEAWLAAGRPPSGQRPGEGDTLATTARGAQAVRYGANAPAASLEGNIEAMGLWAGQSAGIVTDVRPAAELVAEIADQAAAVLEELREHGGRLRGRA